MKVLRWYRLGEFIPMDANFLRFEFWVENNCDICHFKSEMKRVDSQKKKNEDDGA